jgi:hypothetical protein
MDGAVFATEVGPAVATTAPMAIAPQMIRLRAVMWWVS